MQKTKSPILLRITAPVFLLLWMGLIFYLSHQNANESSQFSGGFIEYIVKFFMPGTDAAKLESITSALQFIVRKTAHFTLYLILGILSFLNIITYKSIHIVLRTGLSLIFSVLYSVSDEYHQTFISGRSGELRDVLIDSAGALIGILISLIVYILYNKSDEGRLTMNKRQYIELTDTLSQRLRNEMQRTEELTEENEQLLVENSALNTQLFELRERIVALEKLVDFENQAIKFDDEEATDSEEASEISVETTETVEPEILQEAVVEEAEEAETENAPVVEEEAKAQKPPLKEEPAPVAEPKAVTAEPSLADGIIDGAKVIGKIVLSSAKYCNKLTAAGSNPENKELVNLILGRTEVAKAEILRLSSLEIDSKERLAAMERELSDAEDYFISVMAQK